MTVAAGRNTLYSGRGARAVRLSLFSVVDAFPPGSLSAGRDRYSELLSLAPVAEEAGLSTFWVAEHHFHTGGLCPSPPVLLAAAGAVTRRLRLGVLVGVLPFHSPLDFAEQYALVDQVTGGRLNVGVGSGYIPLEFEAFGIDPATRRERFDRALATILTAWQGGEARVEEPRTPPVRLNVRPRQSPHPPVWIAVQRREAIPHVARKGTNIALVPYATVSGLAELKEEIREYREALPKGAEGKVSVALFLYAGGEPGKAREALQRYLDSRLATQSAFYAAKVREDPRQARAEAVEESGFALFGSPEEVAGRLEAFAAIGVDEILGLFDFGGLTVAEAKGSIRALGPRFASR